MKTPILMCLILFVSLQFSCTSETSIDSSAIESSVRPSMKPTQLRNIEDSILSVDVKFAGDDDIYPGIQSADGAWYVELELVPTDARAYTATWYANMDGGRVLLMEQQGSYSINSDLQIVPIPTTDISSGGAEFDADCDGYLNLDELSRDEDPLSLPGCDNADSETNVETPAEPTVELEAEPPADDSPPLATPRIPQTKRIAGDCFNMGSPVTDGSFHKEDQRMHEVCVEDFEIGIYEVTFEQYTAFSDTAGTVQTTPFDNNWGHGTQPVLLVTWSDALAYTRWLSEETGDVYRLPTEAEWEFAARGKTTTPFWTGETIRGDQENINSENPWGGGISIGFSYGKSLPVGSLQPNPYGLYDMLGNLTEWTCSAYDATYGNGVEQRCDDDDTVIHVVRGGNYSFGASWARVYVRQLPVSAVYRDPLTGFRVVKEVQ